MPPGSIRSDFNSTTRTKIMDLSKLREARENGDSDDGTANDGGTSTEDTASPDGDATSFDFGANVDEDDVEGDDPDDDEYQADLRNPGGEIVEIGGESVAVSRFANEETAVMKLHNAAETLDGTIVPFVPGEITDVDIKSATGVQITNYMYAREKSGDTDLPREQPYELDFNPDHLADDSDTDEDDAAGDLDAAKEAYLDDPESIRLADFNLSKDERKEFARWKSEQDTSSSPIEPSDTEPDRPAKDFSDKGIDDFDFESVDGLGPKTAERLVSELRDCDEIETLREVLDDFNFESVDGIGATTAERIESELRDEAATNVEYEDTSSSDTTDDADTTSNPEDTVETSDEDDETGDETPDTNEDVSNPSNDDETDETPADGSITLLIGVNVVKGPDVVIAEDVIEPFKRKIEEHEDVAHFSCVQYGKGPGKLTRMIRENLDQFRGETVLVSEPHSKFSDPIIEALLPAADTVIKG